MSSQIKPKNLPTPELLFKDGVYDQKVQIKIEVPEKNLKENFDFKAALKKQGEQLVLLAYNPFGFTLFRLADQPPAPLQWTTDVEILNKNKDFFLKIYPQIKSLLNLRGAQLQLVNNQYQWHDNETKILFFDFDVQGRPVKVQITDARYYWVDIENIYK